MSVRAVFTASVTGIGAAISASKTIETTSGEQVDVAITDAVTDKAIALAFVLANLKAVYLLSDQDLSLKTNDATTPQDTIALDAGIPMVWIDDNGGCPFSGNVTALYATNASGSTARLRIAIAEDVAP